MKTTLHILLELDVDPDTLDADEGARIATDHAQAIALRVGARVPVVTYSVVAVPVSREAFERGLRLVSDTILRGDT